MYSRLRLMEWHRFVFVFSLLSLVSSPSFSSEAKPKLGTRGGHHCVLNHTEILNLPPAATASARSAGQAVDMDFIRRHLSLLTGLVPIDEEGCLDDRCSDKNRVRSREYIMAYIDSLGLLEGVSTEQSKGTVTFRKKKAQKTSSKKEPEFEYSSLDLSFQNIIVDIKGTKKPNEVIEITAHYDTAGSGVPGADDNGSGLGAMIDMLRIFSENPPGRSLRFIFMDLEERGKLGSQYHASQLANSGEFFVGSLVLDMFGYTPLNSSFSVGNNQKPRFVLELGEPKDYKGQPSKEGYLKSLIFAEAMQEQFSAYSRDVHMDIMRAEAMGWSADHGSYWEVGLPALLASAPYEGNLITPGYHKAGDTIFQMNWQYYESITRFLTESIALISLTDMKPPQGTIYEGSPQ